MGDVNTNIRIDNLVEVVEQLNGDIDQVNEKVDDIKIPVIELTLTGENDALTSTQLESVKKALTDKIPILFIADVSAFNTGYDSYKCHTLYFDVFKNGAFTNMVVNVLIDGATAPMYINLSTGAISYS